MKRHKRTTRTSKLVLKAFSRYVRLTSKLLDKLPRERC